MTEFTYCKLEIFIPATCLPTLRETLRNMDAGHIGNYDSCLSYSEVISNWRPLAGSNPYIGQKNMLSEEAELKVETVCRTENVRSTLAAIRRMHPYEEPVINVIPLFHISSAVR